jgi:hypothetical protein
VAGRSALNAKPKGHHDECKCFLCTPARCPECSDYQRNALALGLHRRHVHGVLGKRNRKYVPKRFRSASELARDLTTRAISRVPIPVLPTAAIKELDREAIRKQLLADDRLERSSKVFHGSARYRRTKQGHELALKELERLLEVNESVTKRIVFHPKVLLQVENLAYALQRSSSFVVHLLLLHGLKRVQENIDTQGVTLPS